MICAIVQIYCYKKIKSELKKAQILSEKRKADLLAATKDGEKMEHVFVLLAFNRFPVRRRFFDEWLHLLKIPSLYPWLCPVFGCRYYRWIWKCFCREWVLKAFWANWLEDMKGPSSHEVENGRYVMYTRLAKRIRWPDKELCAKLVLSPFKNTFYKINAQLIIL